MTRFAIVDDHSIIREGVRSLLESRAGWTVVGEAEDGGSGLEMLDRTRPDVAIVDLSLPTIPGLELLRQIRLRELPTHAVVLSMHDDVGYAVEAFAHGARGFVTKHAVSARLVEASLAVLDGRRFVSEPLVLHDVEALVAEGEPTAVDPIGCLTPRERQVFYLTASGRSVHQIASALAVSPRTIEVHRSNLYAKLELGSSTEVVAFAHGNGLVGR